MKNLLLISFTIYITLSCGSTSNNKKESEENGGELVCGVKDPVKEIAWLKQRIEKENEPCSVYFVHSGTYQNKGVLIIEIAGPACSNCAGAAVYDCSGELVFVCKPEEEAKITDKRVLWKKE